MNLHKPLEGILRPPLEWYAMVANLIAVTILWKYSKQLLLPPLLLNISMTALCGLAWLRFYAGLKVFLYQRHLKHLPSYMLSIYQYPISKTHLFLGKGFLWTTLHTQRLRDLDLDYNLHYKYPSCLKRFAREKERAWEANPILKYFSRLSTQHKWWNPFRPYPDVGGEPCLHGVSEREADIAIPLIERAGHILVVGLPGVGKTRFAELLIGQDIRRGDVVIVLDPKGDADLLKSMVIQAKIVGRESDFLIFHLGFPETSCRYNPIGNFTRITEVANRISNQLPSSGESAAFKEFGWQFMNSIAMALVAMGEIPDYQKMQFYITKMDILLERYLDFWLPQVDANVEVWLAERIANHKHKKPLTRLAAQITYVQEHQLIHNPIFDDLHHACKYDRDYFSKITASLGPLLKKLTTGKSAELLVPSDDVSDRRPILNWLEVIRNKQIVYVGLDALSDPVVAAAVGNAMFSDLVSVAGRLYKFGLNDEVDAEPPLPLPRICLHADEFNEIIGDEFVPLLNKGRGAGFTVTAYTQTWSDVEARLQNAAKAGQVAGNLGTVVMFRCKEARTVEMFLEQLPKVPILRVIPASNSADTPHGEQGIFYHSTNEDRFGHVEMRLIEQNDVLNLPKGQAFCLLEGGKLYKLRIPLPKHESIDIPASVTGLIQAMRNQTIKRSKHE